MWGIVAASAVTVIGGFLGYAATRAGAFRVERSQDIDAPPERLFSLIDDFHEWPRWSPWEGIDPAMQRTHTGAPRGRGAVYAWQGNRKVGSGRMEILETEAPSRVKIQLDFLAPFEAHHLADFTIQPTTTGSRVTWGMTGESNFMLKVIGVFLSMDRMVGKDFEKGLARMKQVAEG
jgi:uncharacterized protein YndB with AHSA1/START domain